MAIPQAYLLSVKNLAAIFEAIRRAKAPAKFTIRFLEGLGFKGQADRQIINVLKAIGFLAQAGTPTKRYFEYMDSTRSRAVMRLALEEGYSDLFQVDREAFRLSNQQIQEKLKTLTEGQHKEAVLKKMAMTFKHLCGLADFEDREAEEDYQKEAGIGAGEEEEEGEEAGVEDTLRKTLTGREDRKRRGAFGGFHYNIQIILPESRDPQVYDAIFRSLKEHLLDG